MTKLAELEPQFAVAYGDGWQDVQSLDQAQGIYFTCPSCRAHTLLVWFRDRGVPASNKPAARWAVSGTGYADLTLAPSINARCWHGFVRGGEVTNA